MLPATALYINNKRNMLQTYLMMRSALSSSSESSLNIIARRISATVASCRGVAKVGAVARKLPSRALRADLADALPRCVEREEFSTAESVSETRPSGSCGTLLAPAGGLEEVATVRLRAFGHGENTDLFCRTWKRFLSDYHLFHLCDEQLALASDRCHCQSRRPASAVPSGQTRWRKSAPGSPLHSVNEKKAIACRTSSTHACLRAAARNAPAEATGVRARRGAERGGEGTGEERGRWCLHSVRGEREMVLA